MAVWDQIGRGIVQAGRNGSRVVRSAAARVPVPGRGKRARYAYAEPDAAELLNQSAAWARLEKGEPPQEAMGLTSLVLQTNHVPRISVIINVYEPVLKYFEATLISVLSQTYGGYELIIADTSLSGGVQDMLNRYLDSRIRYYSVPGSSREASLINEAARMAAGDYIAFVEVGDLLTKDALYQTALRILQTNAEILYADEDKGDPKGRRFDAPFYKPDFNKDLLLSRNYVGHFLVVRRELFLALRFRETYEGALIYDFLLRAPKSGISHISKILYHVTSASSNARDAASLPGNSVAAGKAALEDYLRVRGISAAVTFSDRRGNYRIDYSPGIFSCRSDVGILGGRVLSRRHKVVGGLMESSGQVLFEGLDEAEGGPYNMALTRQDAYAVDLRCMKVRPELRSLYRDMVGFPYNEAPLGEMSREEVLRKSLLLCGAVRDVGYLIVWDPALISII